MEAMATSSNLYDLYDVECILITSLLIPQCAICTELPKAIDLPIGQ